MEAEAGCAGSRKRKLAPLEASAPAPAPAAVEPPSPESAVDGQDPPLDGTDGGVGDRISRLPDGVLGDIISLLNTKEGGRTQILASRWRHLWRSAPLNLHHHDLWEEETDLDAVLSRILSAHQGPGRRFCAPVYHLHGDRAATADAWLRSPALDNLQELELCCFDSRLPYPPSTPHPLPAAAFRFSDTLCVAIIGRCQLPDNIVQALHFPKLETLKLERVGISESSLHTMIAGCPALRCLLIQNCFGFRCLRITSDSLTGIGCQSYYGHHSELQFGELIIENAPCLVRLLDLGSSDLDISVIFAPKLETLGCLSSEYSNKLVFDSAVIQGLCVDSLTTAVRTVKILADMSSLSLDVVIDFMRCFPCLEKFYIESVEPGQTNSCCRKHKNLTRSLDIRLKTIVWRYYQGNKSHVNLATFFMLSARVLELMTLQVNRKDYNEEFFAKQRKMLQLDSKASRGAQIHFTTDASHRDTLDFGAHCLDKADPFEWPYPSEFHALS